MFILEICILFDSDEGYFSLDSFDGLGSSWRAQASQILLQCLPGAL